MTGLLLGMEIYRKRYKCGQYIPILRGIDDGLQEIVSLESANYKRLYVTVK